MLICKSTKSTNMETSEALKIFATKFITTINSKNIGNLDTIYSCLDFYISTSMSKINFRKIIESTSISNFDQSINADLIKELRKNNYINQTTLPEFYNGNYITIKGLARLQHSETNDVHDIINVFEFIDKLKLPLEELKLKKEELLLVILFLSCNAINSTNALKENNNIHSKRIYERLKAIENELFQLVPNFLGKRIDFSKGKKISWTRYLGEIDNLSKTGIYIKETKEAKNSYYLNLDNIKSINLLFKLSFSQLDVNERLIIRDYISKTNIKIKIGMPDQVKANAIPDSILSKFNY